MIFLQIASYRDKELNSTIQSALSKAKYPNNINFGIVEQCASNDPLPESSNFMHLENLLPQNAYPWNLSYDYALHPWPYRFNYAIW